jgi:hypothetical protein
MTDSSTHRSTDSVDETVDLLLLLADIMDKQSVRVDVKPALLRDLADLIIDLRYDAEEARRAVF